MSATSTDLRAMFEPRSVAVIGASADPLSISGRTLRLLREHGYAGGVYPVNPKYDELLGLRVLPSIGAVPEPVDLALVVVPASVVAQILEECAAAGVRCAVIITSGFAESGPRGHQLQHEIARIAERTGLRVCGPNSEGIFNPAAGLCATFSPAVDPEHGNQTTPSSAGPIAIVSQSGGLAFALLNHAHQRGLGTGAVVSSGNEVDLGWADYVDYLLDQSSTRVVLGFVESFRRMDRLLEVARKSARMRKPIVMVKIGRTQAGKRAAASHTASLVGSDQAYSAALRQLGILRVDDVDEMLDLAAYFSVGRLPAGRAVAILTTSGGAGAWLADACAMRGLDLPPPDRDIQTTIQSFIPEYGSVGNPIDITAQASLGGAFERALAALTPSDRFQIIVGLTTLVREERFFQALPDLRSAVADARASIAFYSYTRASPAVVGALAELGIPCFPTPARTARAVGVAADYAQFLNHTDNVAVLSEGARHFEPWPSPSGALSEAGARAYLEPLGIPSPANCLALSAEEAAAAFAALGGGAVALKVQASRLTHKTDVGGVRLGLRSAAEVSRAFSEIVSSVRTARPELEIDGVLVQSMAPSGVEVFVAARREPLIGPLVVVGLGGTEVETTADIAMRMAPVALVEAHQMLAELRGAAVWQGARGRPASDTDALAAAMVRVSELAASLPPEVVSVEINPLLVLPSGEGVLMLDAAIELNDPEEREALQT